MLIEYVLNDGTRYNTKRNKAAHHHLLVRNIIHYPVRHLDIQFDKSGERKRLYEGP